MGSSILGRHQAHGCRDPPSSLAASPAMGLSDGEQSSRLVVQGRQVASKGGGWLCLCLSLRLYLSLSLFVSVCPCAWAHQGSVARKKACKPDSEA
eukprot:3365413-Rhodomonas_salina.1